jgi:hypothetical protein
MELLKRVDDMRTSAELDLSGNILKYFGVDFIATLRDRQSSKEVRNMSRIGRNY